MLKIFLYFLTSGLAAIVNLATRYFYNLAFSFWLAVVLAYFSGMIVNYLLSKKYVFSSYEGNSFSKTFAKFALVAFLGLLITTLVSVISLYMLQGIFPDKLAKLIAHCCGIGMAFFASFIGHNYFTFRKIGITRVWRKFI